MSKPQWRRKLQYHRRQRRRITSGLIYHKHCNQVIVSKQELYIQLKESWLNENLLACLAFGSGHPRYAYWLLMASIKFWFIGSLSYPLRNSREKAHAAKGTMPQKGEWLFFTACFMGDFSNFPGKNMDCIFLIFYATF